MSSDAPPGSVTRRPTALPRVMLVSGTAWGRAQLATCIEDLCPDGDTDVATSIYDATVRLVRVPADRLVPDYTVDSPNVPEFVRHVARVSPATRILVCADVRPAPPPRVFDLLSWGECEAAPQRWFRRHRTAAASES
ncbi:MAG: hypothetical protein U1F52_19315 [Burkholderiales bacterium]